MGDLSVNFNRSEFACKCGCGASDINPRLVVKLQQLRTLLGRPIVINSGVRCAARNAAVGGVPDSAHITGDAADIKTRDGHEAFELVGLMLYYRLFKRILVEKGCVHVDVDETKPSPWLGVY